MVKTKMEYMPAQNTKNLILSYFSANRAELGRLLASGAELSSLKLDSLELVRFLAFLQKTFRVEIVALDFLDGKSFKDLESISQFLETKQKGAS
jgi:acyl carrier protein